MLASFGMDRIKGVHASTHNDKEDGRRQYQRRDYNKKPRN